jgi:putative ABC transport system permease protein
VIAALGEYNERVSVQFVTDRLFDVIGASPQLGDNPRTDHANGSAEPWVVLSYDWWSTRWGGDPSVIGRSIRIGRGLVRVIAVAAPEFRGTRPGERIEAWLPARHRLMLGDEPPDSRGEDRARLYEVIARSRDAGARNQLETTLQRLIRTREDAGDAPSGQLIATMRGAAPGFAELRARHLLSLVVLCFLFASLVVVLTCVSVAQMSVARTLGRQHEFAVQTALGAGRWQIAAPVIVEQAGVALVAAMAGLCTSWIVLGVVLRKAGAVAMSAMPDASTLAVTIAAAVVTIGIVGVVPALHAARLEPALVLRRTAGVGGVWRAKSRRVFIGVQVLLAVILLTLAAAFGRAAIRQQRAALGFVPSARVTIAAVELGSDDSSDGTIGTRWQRVAVALRSERGVGGVALAERLPGDRVISEAFAVRPSSGSQRVVSASRTAVTSQYFAILQIPILAGAVFGDEAAEHSAGVAVVNTSFARLLGGEAEALGSYVQDGNAGGPWMRVIGVVADTPPIGVDDESTPVMYLPAAQLVSLQRTVRIVAAASAGDRGPIAGALRRALNASAPRGVMYDIRSLSSYVADARSARRTGAVLLGTLAIVALAIAAAGCYGSAAFAAAHRAREAGIRAALGATRGRIFLSFMLDGAVAVLVSAVVGVGIGIVLVGALATQFSALAQVELVVFLGVGLGTIAVAFCAAIRPNWAVASTAPADSLRDE